MNGKRALAAFHIQSAPKEIYHFLNIFQADIVAVRIRIFFSYSIADRNVHLFGNGVDDTKDPDRTFLVAVFEDVGKQIGKNPFQHQAVAGQFGRFFRKMAVRPEAGKSDVFAVFPEILQQSVGGKNRKLRDFFFLGNKGYADRGRER